MVLIMLFASFAPLHVLLQLAFLDARAPANVNDRQLPVRNVAIQRANAHPTSSRSHLDPNQHRHARIVFARFHQSSRFNFLVFPSFTNVPPNALFRCFSPSFLGSNLPKVPSTTESTCVLISPIISP